MRPTPRLPLHRRVGLAFSLAWATLTGAPPDSGPVRRRSFDGGGISRLNSDWILSSVSIDEKIRRSLRLMRTRSRDLWENNGYIANYGRMLTANILGASGIKMQARNVDRAGQPAEDLNKQVEAAYAAWGRGRVTLDGKLTRHQVMELTLNTVAMDGEALIRYIRNPKYPSGLMLQFLDADLLDETLNQPAAAGKNEIRMGIEVDGTTGAPVRYWFKQKGAYGGAGGGALYDVPADQIRHVFRNRWPNQTRGVPWVHSAMMPANMLDGYEEAEVVAARMSAAKMATIETDLPSGELPDDEERPPIQMEFNPGSVWQLNPGEKLNPFTPEHPTTAFKDFIKTCLRKVASALGVFYNVLANDAEGTSYATGRLFRLAESDQWRLLQKWFIEEVEQPLFDAWLEMAVLTGTVKVSSFDRAAYSSVVWQPRGWEWVDPLKDVQATAIELDRGLTSHSRVLAEQGVDFEEVLQERKRDRELATKYGEVLTSDPLQVVVMDDSTDDPAPTNGSKSEGGPRFRYLPLAGSKIK